MTENKSAPGHDDLSEERLVDIGPVVGPVPGGDERDLLQHGVRPQDLVADLHLEQKVGLVLLDGGHVAGPHLQLELLELPGRP